MVPPSVVVKDGMGGDWSNSDTCDCSNGRITPINMLVVRLPARTRKVPLRKLFRDRMTRQPFMSSNPLTPATQSIPSLKFTPMTTFGNWS